MQHLLFSGLSSARVDILTIFAGLFRSLKFSPCFEVTAMVNLIGQDLRSTTGSNLRYIEECSGLDPLGTSSIKLKEKLQQNDTADVPPEDTWRVPYLARLLEQRQVAKYFGQEEKELELANLIESLCKN